MRAIGNLLSKAERKRRYCRYCDCGGTVERGLPAKTRVDRASPKRTGIHPPSPGTLAAAARTGTQARQAEIDWRQIVLRCFSGAAALTRVRQPEQTPASCRPISVGAQSAENRAVTTSHLEVGRNRPKPRSPFNLLAIELVSTLGAGCSGLGARGGCAKGSTAVTALHVELPDNGSPQAPSWFQRPPSKSSYSPTPLPTSGLTAPNSPLIAALFQIGRDLSARLLVSGPNCDRAAP